MAALQDRVCVGIIAGAHGVRGLVRLKSFTTDPAAVVRYGPLSDETGRRGFAVTLRSRLRDGWLASIAGIADRDAAQALAGTRLYVRRDNLPEPEEGEFYHADLIGLAAQTMAGSPLGRIAAIHDFGAGDVLEIARPDAPPLFVPFTQAAVPLVDLGRGLIGVDPPAGLLDDSPPEGAAA